MSHSNHAWNYCLTSKSTSTYRLFRERFFTFQNDQWFNNYKWRWKCTCGKQKNGDIGQVLITASINRKDYHRREKNKMFYWDSEFSTLLIKGITKTVIFARCSMFVFARQVFLLLLIFYNAVLCICPPTTSSLDLFCISLSNDINVFFFNTLILLVWEKWVLSFKLLKLFTVTVIMWSRLFMFNRTYLQICISHIWFYLFEWTKGFPQTMIFLWLSMIGACSCHTLFYFSLLTILFFACVLRSRFRATRDVLKMFMVFKCANPFGMRKLGVFIQTFDIFNITAIKSCSLNFSCSSQSWGHSFK